MGRDRIRYLVFQSGRFRWHPSKVMRASGFRLVNLSRGVLIGDQRLPSEGDQKRAIALNADWDRFRQGLPPVAAEGGYPPRSVGNGFSRAMGLREQERRNKGIIWSPEQHSRDDWRRAWKWIGPTFGDCDPKTVTPELLIGDARRGIIGLRPLVAAKVSESEAHRVIKVWRALWKKMAAFGYCDRDKDPSLAFANSAPDPRQAVWRAGEAVRLIKCAWREEYYGLAALLAVAWDSQLSPIDARSLTAEQQRQDTIGIWFDLPRAKSGRPAKATISPRTRAVYLAYLEMLGVQMVGKARIFRTSIKGRPYTKDQLGRDFRTIRTKVFGKADERHVADFRRSGSVEAFAGDAPPEKVSAKMANSLSTSNRLHKTYGPVQLAAVRAVDEDRRLGRTRLREQTSKEIPTAPVSDSNNAVQKPAKALK